MSPPRGISALSVVGILALAVAACAPATGPPAAEASPATTFAPLTTLAETAATTSSSSSTSTPPSTTTSAPTSTTTTHPPRGTLIVNGTGDVNLDPTFVRSFPAEGYDYAWTGLSGLFNEDDLTVVNLECSPGSDGPPWDKTWTFACDDAAYESARAAGVDVANIANNHGADYGFDAMLTGLDLLNANGITPVGAGADPEAAYGPALFDIDGWTVAVLGATAVGPENGSWAVRDDRPGVAAATNLEAMTAAIEAADAIADVVLITVHWEEQDQTTPPGWVRNLGEAYIEAGADGIFGHHSHLLNPLEWHEGKPIAWGLGNFVWQAFPVEARQTAVAQFVFEPDGTIGACLVPVVIEQTGHPVLQPGYDGPCTGNGPP